jgi:hypothetical protein
MESLIVHPKNQKQLIAIKAFLKALDVSFKKEPSSPYNPEFVAKIKRGEKASKAGKGVKVDVENLWK